MLPQERFTTIADIDLYKINRNALTQDKCINTSVFKKLRKKSNIFKQGPGYLVEIQFIKPELSLKVIHYPPPNTQEQVTLQTVS